MKRNQWKKIGSIIGFLAVAALALSGCSSGSDGSAGPAGPPGPPGQPVTDASKMTLEELGAVISSSTATIDGVTIASAPVVKFTVKDADGNGVTGLGARNTSTPAALINFRFGIAKLVPGTNGSPGKWVNYIVTNAATPPVAITPTTDREGTLVDHGDGSYTYTFYRDLAKIKDTAGVTDVTYDGSLTHRLVLTLTQGTDPEPPAKFPKTVNVISEFTIDPTTKAAIPLTAASTRRDITTTAKCGKCHGDISKMFSGPDNDGGHFDTRPDVRNCITCHTDQQRIGVTSATSVNGVFPAIPPGTNRRLTPRILDGEVIFDMPIMVHKIHMGNRLTKQGYNTDGQTFNDNAYPQDITNCRGCHSGDTAAELAAAPQGNNWKEKPSRMACGSCHDGINWQTGAGHAAGPATSDAFCAGCHNATSIDSVYHVTDNATPNNPNVPAGAVNFIYEISTVTANASQPVVTFRIKSYTGPYSAASVAAATPVTFNNAGAASLLTGFTGSPSFLVTYADGTDSTIDYNNTGKANFQPTSVSIDTVRTGVNGTLTGPDANGFYVATLTSAAAAFPAGARLRAVALQGYFTQISPAVARHTPGVVKAVTNDTVRRRAVDSAKCFNCHEWFEGHGGNRVYEMQMCLPCHVPNLSSSGRIVDLTRPEASQNLKDMIHGIHAAAKRSNPFIHSRAKSGTANIYDWSDVAFPGILNKCEACHVPGAYGSVPEGALMSTIVTTGDPNATIDPATSRVTSTDTLASLAALRNTGLPNATDLVNTPFAAACVACHDTDLAKAHMTANGGAINRARSTVTAVEQCAVCHGPGRSTDVTVIHK